MTPRCFSNDQYWNSALHTMRPSPPAYKTSGGYGERYYPSLTSAPEGLMTPMVMPRARSQNM